MKKLSSLILVLMIAVVGSIAADITFGWDPSPTATGGTNEAYVLYRVATNGNVALGSTRGTSMTVSNIVPGHVTFMLAFTNMWGVSSNNPTLTFPDLPQSTSVFFLMQVKK